MNFFGIVFFVHVFLKKILLHPSFEKILFFFALFYSFFCCRQSSKYPP